jgi:hypothetical protein
VKFRCVLERAVNYSDASRWDGGRTDWNGGSVDRRGFRPVRFSVDAGLDKIALTKAGDNLVTLADVAGAADTMTSLDVPLRFERISCGHR